MRGVIGDTSFRVNASLDAEGNATVTVLASTPYGKRSATASRDITDEKAVKDAFAKGWENVRSLHLDSAPDQTCWFAGDGWWLSTTEAETDAPAN